MVERIKNKKGFTIIEIMVVIALIGILAAVLIPQFGSVRDRARETGVLTNVKSVEAYIASTIDRYSITQTDELESDLGQYFTTNPIENPFTKENTVDNECSYTVADGKGTLSGTSGSIAYDADGDEEDKQPAESDITAAEGVVYVRAFVEDSRLQVYIAGFGEDGNLISGSERVITQ